MRGLTKEYVLKRLGMYFLTIWLGTSLIFTVPRLAPGDPVAAMVSRMSGQAGYVENSGQIIEAWRKKFGLDEPWPVQYVNYIRNALTFELGYSLASFPIKVEEMVARALPWTLGLLIVATVLSFIGGNTIGALLAWRRTPRMVRALLPASLTFTSVPAFMLSIMLIYLFAYWLRWFPASRAFGRGLQPGLDFQFIASLLYHGTLPALSLILTSMGFWALGMRGMMVTTDGEDYMILANAKGLGPQRIFWRYAVRNAMLPQFTALALTLGTLAGGAILVESLFALPGMGSLLYQGIITSDYTLIQGVVFILIVATATAALIIDLIYPLLDPRITYART